MITPRFQPRFSEPYHVVIPHGKKVVAGLVKKDKYNYANPNINDKNYPNDRDADDEFDILLGHYDEKMESDDVVDDMGGREHAVITMADLLGFGAKFPDVQREFPVVELGQSWRGPRRVVLVGVLGRYWRGPRDRRTGLHRRADGWGPRCRFAVRRLPVGEAGK